MLNLDNLIQSNIEYARTRKGRGAAKLGVETQGLGRRFNSYVKPGVFYNKNNEKKRPHEQPTGDYWSFTLSRWLLERYYDESIGVLIIYFDPVKTLGKPPVILGIQGLPITRGFVRSFEDGIYSRYYHYAKSSGAFYKKYIQQYNWIPSVQNYVLNPSRAVEAINFSDVVDLEHIIKRRREGEKWKKISFEDERERVEKEVKDKIYDSFDVSIKYYKGFFKKNSLERSLKKYVKNKLTDAIYKKTGIKPTKKGFFDFFVEKLELDKILESTSTAQKALEAFSQLRRGRIPDVAKKKMSKELISFASKNAPELMPYIKAGLSFTKGNINTQKILKALQTNYDIGRLKIVKKIVNEKTIRNLERIGAKQILKVFGKEVTIASILEELPFFFI